MKNRILLFAATAPALIFLSQTALGIELDWSGQFWSEYNYVNNYSMDGTSNGANVDPVRLAGGGYYIPGGGETDATWETLFLRLTPKIVVNDNIYIKSEFWLGDPIYGIFGNAAPYPIDEHQYNSYFSRGSSITAQRLWAEFLTDFGTVQIGRTPLDWGLGIVWNAGNNIWDKYQSTGDSIRLISKFGAFSFIPSFIMESSGNDIGGGMFCGTNPTTNVYSCSEEPGAGGVTSYSLILDYNNQDENFDFGFNFIKRIAGSVQDQSGIQVPAPGAPPIGLPTTSNGGGMNFNIWDIYVKKKLGKFSISAEVPITSGSVGWQTNGSGPLPYNTVAAAVEMDYKSSDTWETLLKTGYAPGQPNEAGGLDNYRAFYFNPDYQIAMIMFHYQLANFGGPNSLNNPGTSPGSLKSPYDNPIVDAEYLNFNEILHADKWTFKGSLTYAVAPVTAANGSNFYNNNTKTLVATCAGCSQSSSLGFEFDTGASFQWDENFTFGLDLGFYLPGSFYAFSNVLNDNNNTALVFATAAKVGVKF